MSARQVVEHGGQHAARSACRGCDDGAARCVLLAYGQGVGVDQAARLQRLLVARSLDVIRGGLARQVERTGQAAFVADAALYGLLHRAPHLHEVVPY